MRLMLSLCICGSLLSSAVPVLAENGFRPPPGRQSAVSPQRQAQGMTLDAAAARVRRETGGRVLSAETVSGKGGRALHEIKVLTDSGRVRLLRVDSATGNVLPR
jgi:hypothetical protein